MIPNLLREETGLRNVCVSILIFVYSSSSHLTTKNRSISLLFFFYYIIKQIATISRWIYLPCLKVRFFFCVRLGTKLKRKINNDERENTLFTMKANNKILKFHSFFFADFRFVSWNSFFFSGIKRRFLEKIWVERLTSQQQQQQKINECLDEQQTKTKVHKHSPHFISLSFFCSAKERKKFPTKKKERKFWDAFEMSRETSQHQNYIIRIYFRRKA